MSPEGKYSDIFSGPRQEVSGPWDKPMVLDDRSLPSKEDSARFNVAVAEGVEEELRAKAAAKAAKTLAAYGGSSPSLGDTTPPWVDRDEEAPEEWSPSRSLGKKIALGVAAVACTVGFVFTIVRPAFGPGEDIPLPENPLASAQEQTDPASPTTPPPLMANPVRDGQFAFIVTGVQPNELMVSNPNTQRSKAASGKFFAVTMVVENEGSGTMPFDLAAQQIIGVSGATYGLDVEGTTILNGTAPEPTPLNPGQRITVSALFDIPNTDVPAMLFLHEKPGSYGTTVKFTG